MATTARKGVKIDPSALHAHLVDFSKVLGKSLGEVCREQAGLFCLDMIRYSRPFTKPGDGAEKTAKDKGFDNVKKSLYHIFRPLELASREQVAALGSFDVFKKWEKRTGQLGGGGAKGKQMRWVDFQTKYGGGRPPKFIAAGDTSTMKSLHNSLRRGEGHGSLMGFAARAKEPFAIIEKEGDLKAYMKLKQKSVGKLKSAYYFAAQKIRSKANAPAWAKNSEGSSNAIGEDKLDTPMKPEVTVGNIIGGRGTFDSLIRAAISYRAYAMRAVMAAKLNKDKIPLWAACAQGKTTGTAKYF